MTNKELCWLAGLLEGEGGFLLATSRALGRLYLHPRIDLAMTDKDIVVKVATLFGGSFRLQKYSITKQRGYKPVWKTSSYSSKAAALMLSLYPLLGKRRRKKINEILKEWQRTRSRPWGKRNQGKVKT